MDGLHHRQSTNSNTSSDNDDDFKIKGAATRAQNARKDAVADTCTICLQTISERAVTPCNHLTFDFLCLVSWLQERSTCPLCNAEVAEVQYDWRSPTDYKTYHVPPAKSDGGLEGVRDSHIRSGHRSRSQRQALRAVTQLSVHLQDSALERRKKLYANRTYSQHVGANSISQYRDFTPSSFSTSIQLQSRARTFLRRELRVFPFLEGSGRTREFLLEYIIAVLKFHEIKSASGRAEELVSEYLGRENALLLLHELQAWLRSPYGRLGEWDERVQYASGTADDQISPIIKLH